MKTQMDFEGLLQEGKISVIREFLRENIHKYGKMKTKVICSGFQWQFKKMEAVQKK